MEITKKEKAYQDYPIKKSWRMLHQNPGRMVWQTA